jgi:hypothetical protein
MPRRPVILRQREIIGKNGWIVQHGRHPDNYFNSLLIFSKQQHEGIHIPVPWAACLYPLPTRAATIVA